MPLLHEMESKNISPNDITYNGLIDGLYKEGKWQEANKIHHEMLDKGYNLDVITYNSLINGLCNAGKL